MQDQHIQNKSDFCIKNTNLKKKYEQKLTQIVQHKTKLCKHKSEFCIKNNNLEKKEQKEITGIKTTKTDAVTCYATLSQTLLIFGI